MHRMSHEHDNNYSNEVFNVVIERTVIEEKTVVKEGKLRKTFLKFPFSTLTL